MIFSPDELRARPALADGGWSSVLRQRGLPLDVAQAEGMNLAAPALVRNLAREYVAAGVQFLSTNTFAANRAAIHPDLQKELRAINRVGAEICRDAIGDRSIMLCGTIGPSGKILAVGEVSEDEIEGIFSEAAQGLVDGKVDAFLLETFSEIKEALIAIRAIRNVADIPVIASFSFDSGPQRTHTLSGDSAADCAEKLADANLYAIGSNCGAGAAHALPAVVALHSAYDGLLFAKPSGGFPEIVEERPVYKIEPKDFAEDALELTEAGVHIVGGCCGVGPDAITQLGKMMTRRAAKKK
ncbi:MAG: homocysteine S-methyltransferase family protein [Phycisphaerae bacterium]